MAIQVFRQGDDVKIEFKIPSPHVIPANVSEVLASISIDKQQQCKYASGSNREGYGKLTFDEPNQKISLYVEREQSIAFKVGVAKCYVLFSIPNAEFPDAAQTSSFTATVGRVIDGEMLEENM